MADFFSNILNWLLFFPALGAVVVAMLPSKDVRAIRWTAFLMSLPPMVLSIGIFYAVRNGEPDALGFHFASSFEWFPEMGSSWAVGVDGISAAMLLLTGILVPLAILIGWEHSDGPRSILALILFLETAMFGVFVAQDMLLFFLFYELGLVPMYFMINQWGGANRKAASMKFFIVTMAFSLGLLLSMQLVAFSVGYEIAYQDALAQTDVLLPDAEREAEAARIAELNARPNFNIPTWTQVWPSYEGHLDREDSRFEILGFAANALKSFAFLGFSLAFALKIPVWPVHTWLPDAHTEAPTAGSMLLAGVLLKQGAYGFIRLVIPLFPAELVDTRYPTIPFTGTEITAFPFNYAGVIAFLGMMGIVMGAFAAWAQDDLKKLVAYSSVNHMGFVVLGLAAMGFAYSTLWASSEDYRDPVLLLTAVDKDLVDDDIQEYGAQIGLNSQQIRDFELADLTLNQQRELAEVKYTAIKDEIDLGKLQRNGTVALNGAVMQMFNHGLSSAAMFLLVGGLYHRAHTRDTRRFGGLWHIVPFFAGVFVFTSMASLGLPGLNGFTGEWLIVSGAFPVFPVLTLFSMIGLLMTGAYILKGIRILQGPPNHEWEHYHHHHHSLELERRELWAIAPLLVLMLVTGVYPNWILTVINDSVHGLLAVFGG